MSYSPTYYSIIILLALALPCLSAHRSRHAKQPEIIQAINDHDIEALARILRTAGATLNTRGLEGETPLHVAVSVGNTLFVELLVNAGANVTAEDDELCIPLTIAARTGRYDILKILLRERSPINSKDINQATPLHYACMHGYHEIVRCLTKRYIIQGISLDEPELYGKTPLHWATENNNYRTAQILLKAGSNGHAVDWQLRTPCHIAVMEGSYETVKTLRKYGAISDEEDKNHKTPLNLAVGKRDRRCACYLLKYGAYVSDSTATQLDRWEAFDWRSIQLAAARRLIEALESEMVLSNTKLTKDLNILLVLSIYNFPVADLTGSRVKA